MNTSAHTTSTTEAGAMTTVAERPTLTLVKDEPEAIEGTVVEHHNELVDARPAWVQSGTAIVERIGRHALDNRLYITWSVSGYRSLGGRWVDAYRDDYPQLIRSARAALRAAGGDVATEGKMKALVDMRRAEYGRHRRIHWLKTGIWTAVATISGATGVVFGGLWIDLLMGVGTLAVGAYHGRPERRGESAEAKACEVLTAPTPGPAAGTPVAPGGGVTLTVDQLADGKPFPIAHATTPMQAAECILRALIAEGVPVADVSDVVRQPWGWQAVVRVAQGTPEKIISAAGDLETRFDLSQNGLDVQPLVERRACAILRLIDRGADPFASAPKLPYRAPLSISITDKSRLGTSIGGEPLAFSVAGVMGVVIAASGGGKTGLLQAVGEVTTACYDNITVDLDPHGDGLEDLHDAVRVTGRTHEQIESVLLFLLMLSKARARLRKTLGMGKKWRISPEYPAITVIFDEYPKASDLAKKLAFELLLVGRKEAVQVILAAQGGTKLYLGENIAPMVALKVVGPCKVGDTRAVFGDGSVGEGWLPHRLSPATDTDPKDAGRVYAQGAPGRPDEPIKYAIHETPSAALRRLAEERSEAGLVEPDADSLQAMAGVDLPDIDDLPDLLTWEKLLKLCDAVPPARPAGVSSDPGRLVVADALAVMDAAGVDRMTTETLAAALAAHAPGTYGVLTADDLRAAMRDAEVGAPVQLGRVDGESKANPRGYKREVLTAAL
jgi:S-DNA-T family DNA segregation ATPase FtsK/SpoIIIE